MKSRSQACPQARTLSEEPLRCRTMTRIPGSRWLFFTEHPAPPAPGALWWCRERKFKTAQQFLGILPGSLLENIVNSSWVMSQKHRGHTSEPRCPALHTHQVQFIAPSPKRLHRTDHQYPQKAWRLPANSKRDTRPQSLSQDGRGWLLRGQVTDQSFLGLETTEKVLRLFHRASSQHHS